MAYDLEEQEQIATLKEWWRKYGNLTTWLLIVVLLAFAGWRGWNIYQSRQSQQASQLYAVQQEALEAHDNARVQRAAQDIQEKFGRTSYAAMSALVAAKVAFDTNDHTTAKKQLQWILDHSQNAAYQSIAAVRLAGVLLEEKAYDAALKVLSGNFPAAFDSIIADRKGDILLAQGKRDEARVAYQLALDKSGQNDPARAVIQLKLDAVGGATEKAAA